MRIRHVVSHLSEIEFLILVSIHNGESFSRRVHLACVVLDL
jgi:hypothetical protein